MDSERAYVCAADYVIGKWGTGPTDSYEHTHANLGGTTDNWRHNGAVITSGPVNGWQDLWGSSSSDVWLTAAPMMHWDGAHWTTDNTAPGQGFIWGSGPSDVWVANTALYHYNGASWSTSMALPGRGDEHIGFQCHRRLASR